MPSSQQCVGQDPNPFGHQTGTGARHEQRLIESPLGEPLHRYRHRDQQIDHGPVCTAAPGRGDQLAQRTRRPGLPGELDRSDQTINGRRVIGGRQRAINQATEARQAVAMRRVIRCFKGQRTPRTPDPPGTLQIEQAGAAHAHLRTGVQSKAAQRTGSGQQTIEP